MRLHSYSDEAVVLARRNFGEADRILSVFSEHYGKVSFIAKGVRRLKSRKRGHIEVFSYVKFSAASGKGIDIITEVETIDDFTEIRKSLKKVALVYYFLEVISKITHEGEHNPDLFNLLLANLERLKNENKLRKLRLDFVINILTMLGYWPRGKVLVNPDMVLEEVIERQLSSVRVGKKITS
jgi:DNA repair protein RecO (recombination protein O)